MRHDEMQALWHEINIIISTYVETRFTMLVSTLLLSSEAKNDRGNDLLSIKKEIISACILSTY